MEGSAGSKSMTSLRSSKCTWCGDENACSVMRILSGVFSRMASAAREATRIKCGEGSIVVRSTSQSRVVLAPGLRRREEKGMRAESFILGREVSGQRRERRKAGCGACLVSGAAVSDARQRKQKRTMNTKYEQERKPNVFGIAQRAFEYSNHVNDRQADSIYDTNSFKINVRSSFR